MLRLIPRDLIFAAINGALVGLLAPFIFKNLNESIQISPLWLSLTLAFLSVVGITVGYFLSKLFSFFFQLAKFGLVGVANTVIDLGIYNFFIAVTDVATGNLIIIFKTFSVAAAIINSYIWNKYWSFEQKDVTRVKEEFAQFLGVSLLGMLFNVAITYTIVNIIGAPADFDQKQWANVAAAVASIIILGWNFVGYKFFVFKR